MLCGDGYARLMSGFVPMMTEMRVVLRKKLIEFCVWSGGAFRRAVREREISETWMYFRTSSFFD